MLKKDRRVAIFIVELLIMAGFPVKGEPRMYNLLLLWANPNFRLSTTLAGKDVLQFEVDGNQTAAPNQPPPSIPHGTDAGCHKG